MAGVYSPIRNVVLVAVTLPVIETGVCEGVGVGVGVMAGVDVGAAVADGVGGGVAVGATTVILTLSRTSPFGASNTTVETPAEHA